MEHCLLEDCDGIWYIVPDYLLDAFTLWNLTREEYPEGVTKVGRDPSIVWFNNWSMQE